MVVRTALFCFVDVATQVGLVRTVFFFVGNATQVDLLSDERSSNVAPNPVFKEFTSNGVILVRKK